MADLKSRPTSSLPPFHAIFLTTYAPILSMGCQSLEAILPNLTSYSEGLKLIHYELIKILMKMCSLVKKIGLLPLVLIVAKCPGFVPIITHFWIPCIDTQKIANQVSKTVITRLNTPKNKMWK